MQLRKATVIWWRFGKEHGGGTFQANPPEVIVAHLDSRLAAAQAVSAAEWPCWEVDPSVLVEHAKALAYIGGPDTRIYYLPQQGLAVVENPHLPPPDDVWKWYIHLADIYYDTPRNCWVKKDLFIDILVAADGTTHRIIDLDDLGTALMLGLISPSEINDILRRTEDVSAAIAAGAFPFPEILQGQIACQHLGWQTEPPIPPPAR